MMSDMFMFTHFNNTESVVEDSPSDVHRFSRSEITDIRADLLSWYDANKRDLPWRKQASNKIIDQRAYAGNISLVLISVNITQITVVLT